MESKILIGNWKMNKTIKETIDFFNQVKTEIESCVMEELLVGIAPSYLVLPVLNRFSSDLISVAQNMHHEEKGAYTGEISAEMLKEVEIDYVLIGHSERRKYFNETDESCNKKMKLLQKYEMTPIFCIGETLEQYEAKETKEVIKKQLEDGLKGLKKGFIENIVIAYEPVWAIGSGKSADEEVAEEIAAYIKEVLSESLKIKFLDNIKILYGGSVNEKNIHKYIAKENIDGALVGGASLTADTFVEMIKQVKKYHQDKKDLEKSKEEIKTKAEEAKEVEQDESLLKVLDEVELKEEDDE